MVTDIIFTSPFSSFFAVAFAEAGGGAEGRGTDDGDTGPVSSIESEKENIMNKRLGKKLRKFKPLIFTKKDTTKNNQTSGSQALLFTLSYKLFKDGADVTTLIHVLSWCFWPNFKTQVKRETKSHLQDIIFTFLRILVILRGLRCFINSSIFLFLKRFCRVITIWGHQRIR